MGFIRLKIISRLWIGLKYSFRRKGKGVCIDYTVDIAGSRYIEIDDDSWVQRYSWLTVPLIAMKSIKNRAYLSIGKRVQIGRNCFIAASNCIEIENDVLIGPYVTILDHTHNYSNPDLPIKLQDITQEGFVQIRAGAWIGAGAIILGHRGLTIGENAVIAAHAVLTKDLPAHCVAIGNPARIMEKKNEN